MGNRYFDLGNLSVNNGLNEAGDEWLLECYWGEPCTRRRLATRAADADHVRLPRGDVGRRADRDLGDRLRLRRLRATSTSSACGPGSPTRASRSGSRTRVARDLPGAARCVIVGGGVGGCSIAYHLARLGWARRRARRPQRAHERLDVPLGRPRRPAARLGLADADDDGLGRALPDARLRLGRVRRRCGWRPRPSAGRRRAARPAGRRRSGCRSSCCRPSEALERFPLMTTDGVLGASWLPTDGYLDPSLLTYALAEGAREAGCDIHTNTRVTGIDVERRPRARRADRPRRHRGRGGRQRGRHVRRRDRPDGRRARAARPDGPRVPRHPAVPGPRGGRAPADDARPRPPRSTSARTPAGS